MDRKSTPAGLHTNRATYLLNSYCVAVASPSLSNHALLNHPSHPDCGVYRLFSGFCRKLDQNLFMALDMSDYLPGNHTRIAPHINFNRLFHL
jgi:hypothetical protein